MKATQRNTKSTQPEVIVNTLKDLTETGKLSKRQSKRDKAAGKGVEVKVPDHGAEGARDARKVAGIEGIRNEALIEVATGLSQFAHCGFQPNKNKDAKKRLFTPEVETYFGGWKKAREEMGEAQQNSVDTKYSEFRRVCHAYILFYSSPALMTKYYEGIKAPKTGLDAVKQLNSILKGDGSYQSKIAALPTMQLNAKKKEPKQPETGKKLAELAKADKAKVAAIVHEMKDGDIQSVTSNLEENQIASALKGLAVRCIASKDKVFQNIGKTLTKLMKDLK